MDQNTLDQIRKVREESDRWMKRLKDWIGEEFNKVKQMHQRTQPSWIMSRGIPWCWHYWFSQKYTLPIWKSYFNWVVLFSWNRIFGRRLWFRLEFHFSQIKQEEFMKVFHKHIASQNLSLDYELDQLKLNGSVELNYTEISFSNKLYEISSKVHIFDSAVTATLKEFKLI